MMQTSVKFLYVTASPSVSYSFIIPQDFLLSNKIFENQKIFLN